MTTTQPARFGVIPIKTVSLRWEGLGELRVA